MGAAPKQELMINLVCLAHPPQTQTHSAAFGAPADPVDGMSMTHMARLLWNAPRVKMDEVNKYYDAKDQEEAVFSPQGYADEAAGTNALTGKLPELTPADRWLIDVQRRIAADRARQRLAAGHPLPGDEEIIREGDPSSLPSQSPPPAASPSPTSPPHAGDDLPSGEVPHRPVSNPENGTAPVKEKPVAGVGRKGEARPGEIDPRLCKKDPRTQAAAAKLTMSRSIKRYMSMASILILFGVLSNDPGYGDLVRVDDCFLGDNVRQVGSNEGHEYRYSRPRIQVRRHYSSHHTPANYLGSQRHHPHRHCHLPRQSPRRLQVPHPRSAH